MDKGIRFRTKNGSGAIMDMSVEVHEKSIVVGGQEMSHDELLDYASTRIKPNFHEFSETPNYLISKYQAYPYEMSQTEIDSLKVSVILNCYKILLSPMPVIPQKHTKRQLAQYAQDSNLLYERARNYPAQELGLEFLAFQIPNQEEKDNPTIIMIELKSQYLSGRNCDEKIMHDLDLWRGVTQQDIDNKTGRFIGYVHALYESGKL